MVLLLYVVLLNKPIEFPRVVLAFHAVGIPMGCKRRSALDRDPAGGSPVVWAVRISVCLSVCVSVRVRLQYVVRHVLCPGGAVGSPV